MSFTFVVPDIHGRSDLLGKALERVRMRTNGEPGTLVLLGDYVNKGPDSRGVIDLLLAGTSKGLAMIALKGNHDVMMVDALSDPGEMVRWLARGGNALDSYGGAALVPPEHIDWLDSRPLLHSDEHRIYVHAGIDPSLPLMAQSEKVLTTKRYAKTDSGGYGVRHVVHGHDNQVNGPLLFSGRSNLDTCAWRTGRLVIGVFHDDMPGGPVDFIEIRDDRIEE
ncbi:MAG: serine/threonine protein phosphatase [Bradyrhizobiaceae bacterium]|nr:MAG: serine/threonine protein phosphatase [Bradyrhizobiaceae bacterium]